MFEQDGWVSIIKTRKAYVEYYFAGSFFIESSIKPTKDRNVKNLKVPDEAFGFQFFDIIETTKTKNGKKITSKSNPLNASPIYYYGGEIMTIAEVRKKKIPNAHTIISNMKANNWSKVIKCRTGNIRSFDKGDIYINTT